MKSAFFLFFGILLGMASETPDGGISLAPLLAALGCLAASVYFSNRERRAK
jgi:hypothetical protein